MDENPNGECPSDARDIPETALGPCAVVASPAAWEIAFEMAKSRH
jgi:hypothetical protein